MVKLFLVEDEIVMRDGIKRQINWEKEDIEFVGEASDGELAWPMILETKPDILLTDIKMPFMDGLELSALVRKELPDTAIIILSGYDEFVYAQQAVSLGVTDYLLKPLPPGKLLECIRRVQEKIEQERAQPENNAWSEELAREQKDAEKNLLFRALVTNDRSLKEILAMADHLGIHISARYYSVILMTVRGKENAMPSEQLRTELAAIPEQIPGWIFFDRNENGFAMIGTANSEEEVSDTQKELIRRLKECVEKDAAALDIDQAVTNDNSRKMLEEYLRTGTLEEAEPFLEGLFQSIGEDNLNSYLLLTYLSMDMYFTMVRFLKDMGRQVNEIDKKCGDINSLLKGRITAEQARSYLTSYLKEVIALRDHNTEKRYGKILRQAVSYIDTHFDQEDISLNRVAQTVGMSPNHFSSIFSQELGTTFIEYLIGKRMERAKELLRTTQLRSSEVAYRVGYRDPHYFSSTFKKIQGMTPREYRVSYKEQESQV